MPEFDLILEGICVKIRKNQVPSNSKLLALFAWSQLESHFFPWFCISWLLPFAHWLFQFLVAFLSEGAFSC